MHFHQLILKVGYILKLIYLVSWELSLKQTKDPGHIWQSPYLSLHKEIVWQVGNNKIGDRRTVHLIRSIYNVFFLFVVWSSNHFPDADTDIYNGERIFVNL